MNLINIIIGNRATGQSLGASDNVRMPEKIIEESFVTGSEASDLSESNIRDHHSSLLSGILIFPNLLFYDV